MKYFYNPNRQLSWLVKSLIKCLCIFAVEHLTDMPMIMNPTIVLLWIMVYNSTFY